MSVGLAVTHRPRRFAAAVLVSLLTLLVVVVGAAPPQLNAFWRDREIRVDGVNTEWVRLDELEKGPAVAVTNDNDDLYMIVLSSDPQMRRQLRRGVIMWFDPTGGKKETFAIGIPGTPPPLRGSDEPPATSDAVTAQPEPIDQFDVYGPGKNQRQLVRLEPTLGIEMASALSQGTLAYELRLPLKRDGAKIYAVGAAPGATIGFALATPETPVQPSRGFGRPGGPGGRGGRSIGMFDGATLYQRGFGGMGGRRGGGMGGGPQSNQEGAETFKPLKIWTQVHLAVAQ